MSIFWSIILGIIQGLTEFLPVSSSGHLVLVQKLIPSFSQPGVLFDVIIHFGTLLAVFVYFRRKVVSMTPKYIGLLVVGSIPAALVGFILKDFLEKTFSIGGVILALQFLATSLFCFLTDRIRSAEREIKFNDSFFIGLAQAFSILPAVSRSASTIFAGIMRGIDRKTAAEFSFILSIPAILGANLLEIISYKNQIFPIPVTYLVGFLAAFLTGVFTIKLTLSLLMQKKFKFFAYYTVLLAIISMFI